MWASPPTVCDRGWKRKAISAERGVLLFTVYYELMTQTREGMEPLPYNGNIGKYNVGDDAHIVPKQNICRAEGREDALCTLYSVL